MKKLFLLFGVLATFSFLVYRNWPVAQPESLLFSVTDLGEGVEPIAINNHGKILLWTGSGYAIRDPSGSLSEISIPGVPNPVLVAMNDEGVLLGKTEQAGEDPICFRWSPETGLSWFPENVPVENSLDSKIVDVYSLSNEGEVSVAFQNDAGTHRGIYREGRIRYPSSSRSIPKITPGGTVLFRRDVFDGRRQVRSIPREIRRYETTSKSEDYVLFPVGLNDHDSIVGYAFESDDDYRSIRGRMRSQSNDSRTVLPPGLPETGFPFLSVGGQTLNLNLCIPPDSDWRIRWITEMNNSSRIVGYGLKGGTGHGFLLEPIGSPQPATP